MIRYRSFASKSTDHRPDRHIEDFVRIQRIFFRPVRGTEVPPAHQWQSSVHIRRCDRTNGKQFIFMDISFYVLSFRVPLIISACPVRYNQIIIKIIIHIFQFFSMCYRIPANLFRMLFRIFLLPDLRVP